MATPIGSAIRGWLGLLVLVCGATQAGPVVDYRLRVELDPAGHRLQVEVTLAADGSTEFEFWLNAGLQLVPGDGVGRVEAIGTRRAAVALTRYRLTRSATEPAVIRYRGPIANPLTRRGEGFGRDSQTTAGTIGQDGVFLSAASGWFPVSLQADPRFRFQLAVELPPGWLAVSQGRAVAGSSGELVWEEIHPQDDIYLVAARWTRYQRSVADGRLAEVYLRTPDPALAQRYLAATERYLALYSGLIGDYPYAKFALVENFWETGYGMPSFTLLGPTVLRLPFIIHTSYPHEVLHNWWGNGVYIDFAGGNWSEGLTAYLADHLLRALRGQGAAYRRDSLQRYRDFVRAGRDFPLVDFRGRHGPVSQAVGYGKAMMLFHMLRRRLGDRQFVDGLRRFYDRYRFKYAGWQDIRRMMEAVSGQDLAGFFDQWLRREGAPSLQVGDVLAERRGDGWRLTGRLTQTGASGPYALRVPLVLQTSGGAKWWALTLDRDQLEFALDSPQRPLRLMVDPAFDLFRTLAPSEVPAVLSGLFGSPRPLVVLDADDPNNRSWRAMVADWAARGSAWELVTDRDLERLPDNRSVLLVGWANRFTDRFARLRNSALTERVRSVGESVSTGTDALVAVDRHPLNPNRVVARIAASDPAVPALLARKLPHYGKYSYLVMRDGSVRAKGQWPVDDSPLWVTLPGGEGVPVRVPPRPTLVESVDRGR